MAAKEETLFRKKVCADLATIPDCWVESIQQVAIRGTPDLLICIRGKFVGLELKKKGGVVAPLQQYKLDQINKAKGYGAVVTPQNWPEIFSLLKGM
jgi:hypothetical protein